MTDSTKKIIWKNSQTIENFDILIRFFEDAQISFLECKKNFTEKSRFQSFQSFFFQKVPFPEFLPQKCLFPEVSRVFLYFQSFQSFQRKVATLLMPY